MPTLRTEFETARGGRGLRANDDSFIGESVMAKRFATAFAGADEENTSREQDKEFCRILRAAIEQGHEFCPIGVSTELGTKNPMVTKHKSPDSYY